MATRNPPKQSRGTPAVRKASGVNEYGESRIPPKYVEPSLGGPKFGPSCDALVARCERMAPGARK